MESEQCAFLQKLMEYLGHRIDAEGLHATTQKVDAIANAHIQYKGVGAFTRVVRLILNY